ncbi:MAG TPA: NUDIX hydrolase [Desulfohalobiaceae bacterium]|nr:NUDIX hydrolase [Desulfohalobiaceae bacterium]
MKYTKTCPSCGASIVMYRNPVPSVDIIIDIQDQGIVLIERRNPPFGWALPGGFVDYGEGVEQAAVREAHEETGLEVELIRLLGVYSRPDRDPRHHTLSIVFVACAKDISCLVSGDDAGNVDIFPYTALPKTAFDHSLILTDYIQQSSFAPGLVLLDQGKSLCS